MKEFLEYVKGNPKRAIVDALFIIGVFGMFYIMIWTNSIISSN